MKYQLVFLFASFLFFVILVSAESVDSSVANAKEGKCECLNDDCGCCEHVSGIGLNGTICANFSYLPNDYGVSIVFTYNNYTLVNETVSARNPPPICFGIPDLEKIQAHICLRLYDLTWANKHFHGCSKASISVYFFIHKSINLGCFNIPNESLVDAYGKISDSIQDIRDELENLKFGRKDIPTVNMI